MLCFVANGPHECVLVANFAGEICEVTVGSKWVSVISWVGSRGIIQNAIVAWRDHKWEQNPSTYTTDISRKPNCMLVLGVETKATPNAGQRVNVNVCFELPYETARSDEQQWYPAIYAHLGSRYCEKPRWIVLVGVHESHTTSGCIYVRDRLLFTRNRVEFNVHRNTNT